MHEKTIYSWCQFAEFRTKGVNSGGDVGGG